VGFGFTAWNLMCTNRRVRYRANQSCLARITSIIDEAIMRITTGVNRPTVHRAECHRCELMASRPFFLPTQEECRFSRMREIIIGMRRTVWSMSCPQCSQIFATPFGS
jgi:hypothetical protein